MSARNGKQPSSEVELTPQMPLPEPSDDDGALDMLLKTHFSPMAPEGYFDRLWPSVEQRLDDDPEAQVDAGGGSKPASDEAAPETEKAASKPQKSAAKSSDAAKSSGANGNGNGNGASSGEGDEAVVFKSSAALKVLNIPDKRPDEPRPAAAAAVAASAPPEKLASDAPQSGGYAWPVAFVLAAAILTGGFLYYKKQQKITPPASNTSYASGGIAAARSAGSAAGSALASAGATNKTAAATAGSAAAPGADDGTAAGSAAGADDGSGAGAGSAASTATAAAGAGSAAGSGGGHTAVASARRHRRASRRARSRRRKVPGKKVAMAKKPAAAAKAKAKTAAPKTAKTASAGKKNDLNSLIDGAIGKAPVAKKAAKKAAPDPNLPALLTMNQIRTGMRKIRSRVQACYDKYQIEGKATARVKIANSGRVKSVQIRGKFFGTDTGTCVAAAVRRARFPKFKSATMTITYPFLLQ